jgi:hypothetical protein
MRCIRREALRRVEPFFTVDGSFFGPEMMVLTVLMKTSMIQIPVNYTKRVGTSSVTGNKWVAFQLGLRMIALILSYRVRSWIDPEQFETTIPAQIDRALPTVDLTLEADEEDEEKKNLR